MIGQSHSAARPRISCGRALVVTRRVWIVLYANTESSCFDWLPNGVYAYAPGK